MIKEHIVPAGLSDSLGVFPCRIGLMLLGAAIAVLWSVNHFHPVSEPATGWSTVFAVMLFMLPIIAASYAATFALRCFYLRQMIAGGKGGMI